MLMHLKLAGKLTGVQGIVFGEMLDCVQSKDQRYTLQQVMMRIVGDLGIPMAYGLRSGHVTRKNITLPFGVGASLRVNSGEVTLKIMEAATVELRLSATRRRMADKKHIHLIGICGTAMASLAGMLNERGFRVTGSDAAAYPPMSDFLGVAGHSGVAAL